MVQIQANQGARVISLNRIARQQLQTEDQNQAKASMHEQTFENPEQITQSEQPLIQLKNAMARVAADENSSTTRKEDHGGPWIVQTRSRAAKRKPAIAGVVTEHGHNELQEFQTTDISKVTITRLPASEWH